MIKRLRSYFYTLIEADKNATRVVILITFLSCANFSAVFSQITSAGTGNWSSPSTWVGNAVPGANANVVIASGHTVTIDINTAVVGSVTINSSAVLQTNNVSTSTLYYSGNLTIQTNGRLTNNGGVFLQTTSAKTFTMAAGATYDHNPRNVTSDDEWIFERNNEVFDATSNLTIRKWFDLNLPLGHSTRVNGNFGNVLLNIPDTAAWEQANMFTNATIPAKRIFGKLTVSSGTVSMDGTTGVVQLYSDVVVNNTGNIIFASNNSRGVTFQMSSFIDTSTSPKYTVLMDNVFGVTTWTVSGNVVLGHNFRGFQGTGAATSGQLTMNIGGNLTIQGKPSTAAASIAVTDNIAIVYACAIPLTMTVTGSTYITGVPDQVWFLDGGSGAFNFSTTDFVISGGSNNLFLGGNGFVSPYSGTPTVTITRDFIINGVSFTKFMTTASLTPPKLRLNVGRDFILDNNDANFFMVDSKGAFRLQVGQNLNHLRGKFTGQMNPGSTAIDSIFITGNYTFSSPNTGDFFLITRSSGNTFFNCSGGFNLSNAGTAATSGFIGKQSAPGEMRFTVGGAYNQTSGRFAGIYNSDPTISPGNFISQTTLTFTIGGANTFYRGIDNRVSLTNGTMTFSTQQLTYNGGNFSAYNAVNTAIGPVSSFTSLANVQITFANAVSDTFTFVGLARLGTSLNNQMRLQVSVGGAMNITGASGQFISSQAVGRETINITGALNITGGKTSFNNLNLSVANPHPVNMTIGADLLVSNGTTFLSAGGGSSLDSLNLSVGGDVNISGGELTLKAGLGYTKMRVTNGFNMTGGTLFFHKNLNARTTDSIAVIINDNNDGIGNFTHTGGTIAFDTCYLSTSGFGNLFLLRINSPVITLGGTGKIIKTGFATAATTNLYFANIQYGRAGISTFNRSSATHYIQQATQEILNGCSLVVASPNIQIASSNITTFYSLFVRAGGTLNLQTGQVVSNPVIVHPYAGLEVNGDGRVRTARTQGFYDGTTNAAIHATGMNYRLQTYSVVEYNGTATQVVTGIGLGVATLTQHRYSILDINFNGPANTFAYPTNNPTSTSVSVRSKLVLTNGELNLDNDRISTSGGRSIVLGFGSLGDSLTAITRVNGYIRSEVYDSSASLIWKINSRTGLRTIPFGYSSTEYIPLTFNLTSGTCDTLFLSTYRTPTTTNLPYPPGILHVNSQTGADNSMNTVDRFWYIRAATAGASPVANITFTCTASEKGTISDPRAQCWVPLGWQFPLQGVQSTLTNGTQVTGANYFPMNWWTLAGLTTPLPVELISFDAGCVNNETEIRWMTASEVNNDYFTVYKSDDGSFFYEIGTVDGAGTTASSNRYSLMDFAAKGLPAYYKLIQTDFDGTLAEYGPIRSPLCQSTTTFLANAYQSSNQELVVSIDNPFPAKIKIDVLSLDGKLIMTQEGPYDSGTHLVTLNANGFATGIYMVRIQCEKEVITVKTPFRNLY